MSDALPLPPRPRLDHSRKLARELQRAGASAAERGAPIDARDKRFNATALDWALHDALPAADPVTRERAYQLIELLCRAGARPEFTGFAEDLKQRIRADERLQRAFSAGGSRPSR